MIFRQPKLWLLLSALALSTASFAGGSLERVMKQMQQQHKLATQSQTLSQMQPYVTKLQSLTQQATALSAGKAARPQYKEQMQAVLTDLEALQAAIDAGDLAAAKAQLAHIAQTKKAGHKALKVHD